MSYDGGSISFAIDGAGIGYSYNSIHTTLSTTEIIINKARPISPYSNVFYTSSTSGDYMDDSEMYMWSGFFTVYYPAYDVSAIIFNSDLNFNSIYNLSYNRENILAISSGSNPIRFVILNSGDNIITGTNIFDGTIVSIELPDNPTIVQSSGSKHQLIRDTQPENVLLVYNTRLPASIELKDYYTGMRTGLKGLNILGIDCFSGEYNEITNTGEYVREIRLPIHNYIRSTNKPIKYCILMYGIPTRITGTENINSYSGTVQLDLMKMFYNASGYCRYPDYETDEKFAPDLSNLGPGYAADISGYYCSWGKDEDTTQEASANRFLLGRYYKTTFLCSHLFADTATDVSGYIRHICRDGVVDGIYIRGSGYNTGAVIVEASSPTYPTTWFQFAATKLSGYYSGLNKEINHESFSAWTGRLQGVTGYDVWDDPKTTGVNIGDFYSWGIHTSHANGPGDTDDWSTIQYWQNIFLTGYNWWAGYNIESYGGYNHDNNGVDSYWFSSPKKQFAHNSFYGTDYSNVPVGWMSTVIEPSLDYMAPLDLIQQWQSGLPIIECLFGSTLGLFRGTVVICDPFVKKF